MINPTPGRVLWFYPSISHARENVQPQAALCAFVRHERCVNLAVVSTSGDVSPVMNVPLLQDDDEPPQTGGFAVWMPYQTAQAKKHESPPTNHGEQIQELIKLSGELMAKTASLQSRLDAIEAYVAERKGEKEATKVSGGTPPPAPKQVTK